jgi:hypothetical protein
MNGFVIEVGGFDGSIDLQQRLKMLASFRSKSFFNRIPLG